MSLLEIDWCEEAGVPRSQCVKCQTVVASAPPESHDTPAGAAGIAAAPGASLRVTTTGTSGTGWEAGWAVGQPNASASRVGHGSQEHQGANSDGQPAPVTPAEERRLEWKRDAELEDDEP